MLAGEKTEMVGDAAFVAYVRKGPCAQYTHDHPPVRNVNTEYESRMRPGQIIADKVASAVGSWTFIIIQSCLLVAWMGINVYLMVMIARHPGYLKAWDPYPFILLNLVLSFQAAYTGPVVMMSQNRQSEKDRLAAQHDYEVNMRAEKEIMVIMRHLVYQDQMIARLAAKLGVDPVSSPIDEELIDSENM